ncbi:MAG: phytanoyl-CoA dioxygenase family protein [Gemmatimonadota bacterium]|nr:phytanoyl-CoA dioxygenase family protein [Gemmatimonadota bacterium]
MLTGKQHRFFDTFGYLHLKQVFSPVEIDDLTREADRIWAEDAAQHPEQTHQSMSGFIEKSPLLFQLAVDDRIYGVIESFLKPGFVWGNSEGNKGSFNVESVHNWHCDRVGEYDMDYMRIKVMIYLTPTTREEGALRIMPGSHKAPLHHAMVPVNAQKDHSSDAIFGMPGWELPGHALESQPGDVVFFNHYLFHAVYGKTAARRYVALKFADKPVDEAHFQSLRRHHQGPGNLHEEALKSENPRMQGMIAPLLQGIPQS